MSLQHVKKSKASIRRSLLSWYDKYARDLPWRRTRNPYRIWLSEIMLQQTRVEAVIDYYFRFLQALPTVKALAEAPEDQVLKLWEGLGYYSRARNLQKAAKIIVEQRKGKFPKTPEQWQELPGIGRYSAGAISSIAFGVQTPVLDGNVKRILARIFLIEDFVEDTKVVQEMWNIVEKLVPEKRPGDFNQAMMELGARVCLPKNPLCRECPVTKICFAKKEGVIGEVPKRRPKKAIPHKQIVAAAIKKNGRYLLGKRSANGMLGGLWEFPGGKIEKGETPKKALRRELKEELGVEAEVGSKVAVVDHVYSHFSITLTVFDCSIVKGRPKAHFHSQIKWVPRKQFNQYAFPAANLKFMDKIP